MKQPMKVAEVLEHELRDVVVTSEPPPTQPFDDDEARIGRELARLGVPPRFREHRLDAYRHERPDQQRALAGARAVIDDRTGLFLGGPVGTGKTHLLVGIAAELARQGRVTDAYGAPHVAFRVVPELLDELRRTIRYPEADDPFVRLWRVPLLLLDDLGAEKPSEYVHDRLYLLLNHRYNARLVTVATSNFGLNELIERGYERVVSRLCDDDAAVVWLDGPDERMAR